MLNVDVKMRRISNGYIVTGNDSTQSERYFATILEFIESDIVMWALEKEKRIKHGDKNEPTEFWLRFEEKDK